MVDAEQPESAADLFQKGIELFNAGEYFECHEVLEDCWNLQQEPEKQLTQGILQVAVALYHLGRNNPEGARRLLTRAMPRLAQFTQKGAPWAQLYRDAAELLATLERDNNHRPQTPPRIGL